MKKTIEVNSKLKDVIYNGLFDLYLWLSKFGREEGVNNRVYDNYGIIDTLGNTTRQSRFTYSLSEELGSYWVIKLPFGRKIELIDYSEKYIYLYL